MSRYLVLISLFTIINLSAQKSDWHNKIDTTATWSINTHGPGSGSLRHFYKSGKQVEIGDSKYYEIVQYGRYTIYSQTREVDYDTNEYNVRSHIRIEDGKMFVLNPFGTECVEQNPNNENEYLVADFNLEEGDSFQYSFSPDTSFIHVLEIETINFNNESRKVFTLSSNGPKNEITWVEGVGVLDDGYQIPNEPMCGGVLTFSYSLDCWSISGRNELYPNDDCITNTVSVNQKMHDNLTINLIHDKLAISGLRAKGEINLFNQVGQHIGHKTIYGNKDREVIELNTSNEIIILKISTDSGVLVRKIKR